MDGRSESLTENAHWRENNFGRSAPVLGRSNAALPEPLEKLGAIACCTVLWPGTATLRKQAFQSGSEQNLRLLSCGSVFVWMSDYERRLAVSNP